MDNNKPSFTYTYSAAQQEEVKQIRDKYVVKEEDAMDRLRRLDASATRPGSIAALVIGILSSLLMGSGMSLVMTDIGATLGIANAMVPGIILGVLGLAGAALAYPVYVRVTKKQREKLAPEILRLTDELMK